MCGIQREARLLQKPLKDVTHDEKRQSPAQNRSGQSDANPTGKIIPNHQSLRRPKRPQTHRFRLLLRREHKQKNSKKTAPSDDADQQ